MIFSDATIDAAVIGGTALIIGAALTIIGGFLVTYMTQSKTNKAERSRIIREKIEDAFTLLDELEAWSSIVLVNSYNKSTGKHEWIIGVAMKYQSTDVAEIDIPISKLRTLILLYVPDAEETYRMYQKNCAVIHFLVSCLKNEPNAYKFNALIENLMNEHNQKNNTEFKNVGEYIQNLKREHNKITDMMDSELRKAHKHSLK